MDIMGLSSGEVLFELGFSMLVCRVVFVVGFRGCLTYVWIWLCN